MDIKEYLRIHHLPILKEYERSQLSWDELKVGSIVLTLRAGFGGGPGMIGKVIEKDDESATLSNLEPDGHTYSLYKNYKESFWWKDVAIIDYGLYNSLGHWRRKEEYLNQLVGYNITQLHGYNITQLH
jgi:hypothetical protein